MLLRIDLRASVETLVSSLRAGMKQRRSRLTASMSDSDFSQREVPMYAGTLTGFRRWSVARRDGTLRSLTTYTKWSPSNMPPPICVGRHRSSTHVVPDLNCTCGYYAYFGGSTDHYRSFECTVQGVVQGWGRMIVGDKGFRAQHVKILGLVFPQFWYEDPNMSILKAERMQHISPLPYYDYHNDGTVLEIRNQKFRQYVESNGLADKIADEYAATVENFRERGFPIYRSFEELIEAHPLSTGIEFGRESEDASC